jgi:hypothetical protein
VHCEANAFAFGARIRVRIISVAQLWNPSYGAEHMRAVVHDLSVRFGYRPVSADWLNVFRF